MRSVSCGQPNKAYSVAMCLTSGFQAMRVEEMNSDFDLAPVILDQNAEKKITPDLHICTGKSGVVTLKEK